MKFFCSSLDIRDNLKVAFFGKIWQVSSQKKIVPLLYLVINITDWLSRVFLKLLLHLVTAVEIKVSILLKGAQGASAVCNKTFTDISQLDTAGQWQIYWEAGPQTSAHCQCPKKWYSSTGMTTLISQNQLPDIYLDRLNFFRNMPLLSYLWCPIMKTNFNQFFRFYISRVHDFC